MAKILSKVNLALQGGGSHGAFTWGLLDWLLEHQLIDPTAVSGASAGSMNLIALMHGWRQGLDQSNVGNDKQKASEGAREALDSFWRTVAQSNSGNANAPQMNFGWIDPGWMYPIISGWMEMTTRVFSPYQLNPFNWHPLKPILEKQIDFARLNEAPPFPVFVATTRVTDGKLKVFRDKELSADVFLASACLPTLFQAINIGGEHYWDGGYTADPALWPLFYEKSSDDTLLLMVNPLKTTSIPTTQEAIIDRLNEVSFNASLQAEMRAIGFVQKMHAEGWLKPEFAKRLRNPRLHAFVADKALEDLDAKSKMRTDLQFLLQLKDRGRKLAEDNWGSIEVALGKRSSFNVKTLLQD